MAIPRLCSIPDCGKRLMARGWCAMHYSRWRAHGDPSIVNGTPKGAAQEYFRDVVLPYRGDDCLIWPFQRNTGGYGFLWDGTEKDRPVHRMACEEVNGPPPTPDHDAAHTCGNGYEGCCNPLHTRWATRSENMMDRVAHGTDSRGEKNWNVKLTEEDVRTIRALNGTISYRKIGALYGVSYGTINDLMNRRTWAWLD